MWAYTIDATRNRHGFARIDVACPVELAPHQVLVRMRAVSLNARDLQVLDATLQLGLSALTPLSDGSGEVVAVGDAVRSVRPGERVVSTFFQSWIAGEPPADIMSIARGGDIDGVLAEYVVFREEGVIAIPEHLSYEEAATLPVAALTAWHALVHRGRIHAGQRVLLLGTGGVSMFALQFARLHGADVVMTSSNDEKLERAKALGAAVTINYRSEPNWGKRVQELVGGVDHVVEVGGTGTLVQSLEAVKNAGQVHLIGVLSSEDASLPDAILSMIKRMVTLRGVYGGSREMFEAMNQAIERNRLRPVIDRVFSLSELDEAVGYMRGGSHMGKVVISLG